MKYQDWFTSNLDDVQRQIVMMDLNNSFIVQGSAGSGKTILALHRAAQANAFGDFAIIVYTKALKAMIEYGLQVLGLPKDRAVYEWSWDNRGIDKQGDVFMEIGPKNIDPYNAYGVNPSVLYLKQGDNIERYLACNRQQRNDMEDKLNNILANIQKMTLSERRVLEAELSGFVTIDYADFVPNEVYYTFLRRSRWFYKKDMLTTRDINLDDTSKYALINNGSLYKSKLPVDYMIVDEAQDFSIADIGKFKNDTLKSMVLFGDTLQQVYADRGASLDRVEETFQIRRYFLSYNYRLPKTVAKVAEKVSLPQQNLVDFNRKNNGKSDFPDFPKPTVKSLTTRQSQIDFVISQIEREALDDVGILLPSQNDVEFVWNYLQSKGIDTQVRFTKPFQHGPFQMFRQIDTLDFTDPNLPSILTFHSSKGTQFDNVFILFAENGIERNPFYVALTRTSRRIYITYTQRLTTLLQDVPQEYLNFA